MTESRSRGTDDTYPLIMVSGAGDAGAVRRPLGVEPLVLYSKRPWSERWPDWLTACWMLIVLLGLSILIFYAIGVVMLVKHDSILVTKCKKNLPADEVHYHVMIGQRDRIPLADYADYLSSVSTNYPNLRINVYFLVGRLGLFDQFLRPYNYQNRKEISIFQKKHPNVYITLMTVNKLMSMTPFKDKWNSIPEPIRKSFPESHLLFFARVLSVWIFGGVGLDLESQNKLFLFHEQSNFDTDCKINTILKLHNEGISYKKYVETLNKIVDSENRDSFVDLIIYFIQNKIRSFFSLNDNAFQVGNPTDTLPSKLESAHLVRKHRNKRNVIATEEHETKNETMSTIILPDVNASTVLANTVKDVFKTLVNPFAIKGNETNTGPNIINTKISYSNKVDTNDDGLLKNEVIPEADRNESYASQPQEVITTYDLSVMSNPIKTDKSPQQTEYDHVENNNGVFKAVVIAEDGSLVTSTSPMHPILGTILMVSLNFLSPEVAINYSLGAHCSGLTTNETICNIVYVL